jgi:large subunit ribosomal protein L1
MKQEIMEAVKKAKDESKPRNFTQSVDVVINIKDLDVKKPENRIEEEIFLPNGRGKAVKIAFIADGELALQAKNPGADLVIDKDELEDLGKDRKAAKKMANQYNFFVAQADMMPLVGRFLGPVLGPRKKMPRPVPITAKPDPIMDRLKNTVKIRVKDQPVVQAIVGSQEMEDEMIADNIEAILNVLDQKLEKGRNQIKSIYVKTTMGPVERVI